MRFPPPAATIWAGAIEIALPPPAATMFPAPAATIVAPSMPTRVEPSWPTRVEPSWPTSVEPSRPTRLPAPAATMFPAPAATMFPAPAATSPTPPRRVPTTAVPAVVCSCGQVNGLIAPSPSIAAHGPSRMTGGEGSAASRPFRLIWAAPYFGPL